MATLTFTKISDPINPLDLAAKVLADTGKAISVVVNSSSIDATGTISEADRAAIQTSMNNYYYAYTQTGTPVVDNPDMSTMRHDAAVTQYAAYMGDTAAANTANKLQTGSTIVTGGWPVLRKASTNSSGVATIYLTLDGTAATSAIFGTVYEDGIVAMPVGANNYQVTSCVVSSDKKTLTVTLNQIASVLGILTFSTTAGAGVEVRAAVWGKP